jgi:hypothetical protein
VSVAAVEEEIEEEKVWLEDRDLCDEREEVEEWFGWRRMSRRKWRERRMRGGRGWRQCNGFCGKSFSIIMLLWVLYLDRIIICYVLLLKNKKTLKPKIVQPQTWTSKEKESTLIMIRVERMWPISIALLFYVK